MWLGLFCFFLLLLFFCHLFLKSDISITPIFERENVCRNCYIGEWVFGTKTLFFSSIEKALLNVIAKLKNEMKFFHYFIPMNGHKWDLNFLVKKSFILINMSSIPPDDNRVEQVCACSQFFFYLYALRCVI